MENSVKKPFGLGIIVGRFQAQHVGHEMMIDKAIELCDNVGIFIGSSQESGTVKNPFDFETRKRLLKRVFGDKVSVYPLPDLGVGNNCAWGDYVLRNVEERFGRQPDLLVSGKEIRRVDWFDAARTQVYELYVPKSIEISATQLRQFLIDGDAASWKKYTDPVLWDEFENLRKAVIESKDNLETASI